MNQMKLSRRNFLKIIGIAGLSLVSGTSLTGCDIKMKHTSFTISELKKYKLSIYGTDRKEATLTYLENNVLGSYCGKILVFEGSKMYFDTVTNLYHNEEEANETLIKNIGITESYDDIISMLAEEYGAKAFYSAEEIKSFIEKQNELLQIKETKKTL